MINEFSNDKYPSDDVFRFIFSLYSTFFDFIFIYISASLLHATQCSSGTAIYGMYTSFLRNYHRHSVFFCYSKFAIVHCSVKIVKFLWGTKERNQKPLKLFIFVFSSKWSWIFFLMEFQPNALLQFSGSTIILSFSSGVMWVVGCC